MSAAENNDLVCEIDGCWKTFSKLSRLRDHERIHSGTRPYSCNVPGCGKRYSRPQHLKRHQKVNHSDSCHISSSDSQPSLLLSCEYDGCGHTFISKDSLKKHTLIAHAVGQYKCAEANCDMTFAKRCQLRAHHYEHQGVLPFQCHHDGCRKQFKQGGHLKRHLKMHDGYTCPSNGCQERFYKWSLLRKHVALAHKKVHRCDICAKTFEKRCMLTRHMRSKHVTVDATNVSDLSHGHHCTYSNCDRTYIDLRNLTAHILSDHCGRKFACHHCSKVYSTKQKLREHIRKVHEGNTEQQQNKPRPDDHRKTSIITTLAEFAISEQEKDSVALVRNDLYGSER